MAKKNPKYEKINMQQISLIKDTIRFYQEGRLKKSENSSSGNEIVVYDSGIKCFKNERLNDLVRCYNIKVIFDVGKNYPYKITIYNSYNKIKEMPDRTLRIGNDNVNPQNVSMMLSVEEWTNMIDIMSRRVLEFETCMFSAQKRLMDSISWKPN